MTVDWEAFAPGAALAGGGLIGLAAAVLIILTAVLQVSAVSSAVYFSHGAGIFSGVFPLSQV